MLSLSIEGFYEGNSKWRHLMIDDFIAADDDNDDDNDGDGDDDEEER
jgi:hypothetical protein